MLAYFDKRKPNAAEQAAIDKYVTTMNSILDQFRGPDWDEHIDEKIENPMLNPVDDRPFDLDQVMQRTYDVKPDSKRFLTMIKPRAEKIAQEKDASARDLQRAQMEDLAHLQVEVHCNLLVVPMITGPDPKKDPKIPGATFVHKDRNNPFGHGVAYIMFFSNGKPGRWEEVNDVYRNFFIHPPNSPYIENLEVRIYGPEDRIKELLHKINWKQVNAALTQ